MITRGSSAILITGATAGIEPQPTSAAFAPAKFAVRGLAQVLSRDLHPQGIHVLRRRRVFSAIRSSRSPTVSSFTKRTVAPGIC
ncbi:MAG: SDR family NAD(P)-dependent oxidoreductase [Candidatus Binatia bacterium]